MTSLQTLSDAERRIVARWAAACAERVQPLFEADEDAVREIQDALARTRAYSAGRSSAAEEISKRLLAVKAAKVATTDAGAAAARAVAQASAVAHMGAHALGAAAYAVKAVSLANTDRPAAVEDEIRWQLANLSEHEQSALRQLPPLGTDSSGPLAEGLLSRGILGSTIREIQAQIGSRQRREIVAYETGHRGELLDLAIRAWAPVFPQMKSDVPDFVYDAFYPEGWEARQRADLAEVLDGEPETVDVAIIAGTPVGWVCTRLHHEDSMGEIYVIAVEPAQQGSGVGTALMKRAYERARLAGMQMMMVETGDDSGHRPARALYESDGFVRWPVARYFKDLRPEA